jgi:hypothetical protein
MVPAYLLEEPHAGFPRQLVVSDDQVEAVRGELLEGGIGAGGLLHGDDARMLQESAADAVPVEGVVVNLKDA